MKTSVTLSVFALGIFLLSGTLAVSRQSEQRPAATSHDNQTTTNSSAKRDMKDAGRQSKNAAKDAGNGVKAGTEKAYRSSKHGIQKGAQKTKNAAKGAVNGGKAGAKQPVSPLH